MAMAQETYDAQPKFNALPPDITTPLYASIEEATHLLHQDVVSTAQTHFEMVTHHRDLLGHAITSLTLQPSVALHRCGLLRRAGTPRPSPPGRPHSLEDLLLPQPPSSVQVFCSPRLRRLPRGRTSTLLTTRSYSI
jgi:hypothetical protein